MRDKNGENVNQSGTRRESALNPTRQHSLEWREVLTACCNFYSKLKLLGMLKKLRVSLECVAGFPMTLCQEVQLLSNNLLSTGLYSELFPTTQKFKSPALKTLCFWLALNMLIQICSKSDSNIWLQRVGNVCLDIRYPLWVQELPQNWPNYCLAIKGRVQKTKLAKTFNMSNIQESEAFLNKRTIHT